MPKTINSIASSAIWEKVLSGRRVLDAEELTDIIVSDDEVHDFLVQNAETVFRRYISGRIASLLVANGKKSVIRGTKLYADPRDINQPEILECLMNDMNKDINGRKMSLEEVQLAHEALLDGQQVISDDGTILATPTKDEMVDYLRSLA